MKRLLRIDPVPECVAVLDAAERDTLAGGPVEAARLAVETLVARGLAPLSLLDERPIAGPSAAREGVLNHVVGARAAQALLIALRNPTALVTAEALLREGLDGTPGIYAGLRTWHTLAYDDRSTISAPYLPSRSHPFGFDHVDYGRLRPSRRWLDSTRDSEVKYHEQGYPMIWRCADHIAAGPDWVRALYETGLGLWCWRSDPDVPEWVLVVREGDGFPWPEWEGETQKAPAETGA